MFSKRQGIHFYFCETQTWFLDLAWYDDSNILEIKANTLPFCFDVLRNYDVTCL